MRELIVLFGGTFDPIHIGHLRVAIEVREQLQCEQLRLIPTGDPQHRSAPRYSATQRADMVETAIAGCSGLAVDRCEVNRSGHSYTIDTLRAVRGAVGPETALLFLLGRDQLSKLDTWQGWQNLTNYAHLGVLNRPGDEALPAVVAAFCASRRARSDMLRSSAAGSIVDLAITQLAISSSAIRARLDANQSVRWLVPDCVLVQLSDNAALQH